MSTQADETLIFLIDIQSFFASIEKNKFPHLRHKPIVVAGDPSRRSGIILAACPLAKRWGVETAEALWKAQRKCPQLIVLKPHMQSYIDASIRMTNILGTFSDLVEPFSIDEQFVDMTHTLHLFAQTANQAAQQMQAVIQEEIGVYARVGIGPNKVLAKMACDHFAKKNPQGVFWLDQDNMVDQLWPLPIGKLFGVGSRMRKHLEHMGIRTIGQLANHPLKPLKKRWGINGELLWMTAQGIDFSPVSLHTHDQQKAVGHHMTLPRDYSDLDDIKVVLLELSEEVGRRARLKKYIGQTIAVGVRGTSFDVPTGFYRQQKLDEPTDFGLDIFKAAIRLFHQHWDGSSVRSAGVTLSSLQTGQYRQLNLFEEINQKERLSHAMDHIKEQYGAASLLRAVSLTSAGQATERAKKIGGHYK